MSIELIGFLGVGVTILSVGVALAVFLVAQNRYLRADLGEVLGLKIDSLRESVKLRFDKVDASFNSVDNRFSSVNARLEIIDSRIANVEARFDRRFDDVETRFFGIDVRLTGLDKRINDLNSTLLQGAVVVDNIKAQSQS